MSEREGMVLVERVTSALAAIPEADRGTVREVDRRNELGWQLVPVDIERAGRLFFETFEQARKLEHEIGIARASLGLAYVDFHRADYGVALERASTIAGVFRREGTGADRANLLLLEGHVQWSLGDYELAIETLVRCRDTSLQSDYPYGEGWSQTSLAGVYEALGDLDRARELHERAITRFREAGVVSGEARARAGLGKVLYRDGRYRDALEAQRESLAANRDLGSELGAAVALNDMGLCYQALGDVERAEASLREALAIRERFENWPAVVTTLLALGTLEHEASRPEVATPLFERAVELSDRMAVRPKLWRALEGLSLSLEAQGRFREALEHFRRAQAVKEEVQGEETSTKLRNLQARYETEAETRRAELERVRGVELAGALDRLKTAQARIVQTEKSAAVGRLVAGVSHELNSPVAALASAMDTQARGLDRLRGAVGTEGQDRLLAALEDNARGAARASERITEVVRRLQQFSQLDQSEFRRADLAECVASTCELVRSQASECIAWSVDLEPTPPLDCYPASLNQALMTLLVNATESIEGEGAVRVTLRSGPDALTLRVSDTGRGIEPERLDDLFEVGFSRSGARVKMSAGLANVRAAVDQHRGDVTVQSAPGEGTTFTIVLPTGAEPAAPV